MAIEADWYVRGDAEREAAFFSAVWKDGSLRVFSRFAFEVRWCEENLSPDLVERAKLELSRSVALRVGRSQSPASVEAACIAPT